MIFMLKKAKPISTDIFFPLKLCVDYPIRDNTFAIPHFCLHIFFLISKLNSVPAAVAASDLVMRL